VAFFFLGVSSFNGKQGCLKCTTEGEYSYNSHTVFFPRAGCAKRTNDGFRSRIYGSHHKKDSPLLSLPIDMIEDFPVGDSLHLIDLGIMKRCLLGWRDGNFGNYRSKLCAKDISKVSMFLEHCKMPCEIHRSVRSLEVLCHWKGSEYRTFLFYLGVVILKDVLSPDVYCHFLTFFCAITICSSKFYTHFFDLADSLLSHYVEYYRDIYGQDYMSSNIHNLTHLVDEVKKFGILSSFNAYPFENRLYQIKNLLRNGNLPLSQVAKRMSEIVQIENDGLKYYSSKTLHVPTLKCKNGLGFFSKVEYNGFTLSSDTPNKWFLTKSNEIVAMQYATVEMGVAKIYGCTITERQNIFEIPIQSSFLNIFKSARFNLLEGPSFYSVTNIKCKLVFVEHNSEAYFFPLLHTL